MNGFVGFYFKIYIEIVVLWNHMFNHLKQLFTQKTLLLIFIDFEVFFKEFLGGHLPFYYVDTPLRYVDTSPLMSIHVYKYY